MEMIGWVAGLIVVLILVIFFLKRTLIRIPYPEHWVIDRFGKLHEKGPGFKVILSFLGIDKVYARIATGVDYAIGLFPEEEHWIDLTIGGRVRLTNPQIWINVKSPLTIAQESLDFESQIKKIAEQRLTGTVNLLEVKDVLKMRAPSQMSQKVKGKLDEMISGSGQLQEFLRKIDVRYVGFTIEDFDFERKITEAREEKVTTSMQKDISKNKGEATRRQLAAIGKTAKDLVKAGFDPLRAQKTSSDRYQDHLAAEQGSLQKIVWQGGSNIPGLAAQWEKGKTTLPGGSSAKDSSKEQTEEESEEPTDLSVEKMELT